MLFRQFKTVVQAFRDVFADSGFSMAGAVAYSFVLSLFPFCIFLGALAGYFGGETLAKQAVEQLFQMVPKPVAEAMTYRFTLVCSDGKLRSFDAAEPWATLTPVWGEVPVGPIELRVEGLDSSGGQAVGLAGTRSFHRAAEFNGPYGKPVLPYDESARVALRSVILEPFVRPVVRNWNGIVVGGLRPTAAFKP